MLPPRKCQASHPLGTSVPALGFKNVGAPRGAMTGFRLARDMLSEVLSACRARAVTHSLLRSPMKFV